MGKNFQIISHPLGMEKPPPCFLAGTTGAGQAEMVVVLVGPFSAFSIGGEGEREIWLVRLLFRSLTAAQIILGGSGGCYIAH